MNPHFEALELLREWSTALVVVQTGALALLGGLIDAETVRGSCWLVASLG
jgi:hypothetical protein